MAADCCAVTMRSAIRARSRVIGTRCSVRAAGGIAVTSTGAGSPGLKAISVKKGITVVSIASSRMLEAHGFLRRIFAIFDAAETPVDLVTTSEVSVSVTIEKTAALPGILEKLEDLGQVTVENDLSIICMVGRDLWKDPSFPAKAFGALKDIPVRMISLGASEVNLSLVVPALKSDAALKNLHHKFFS